MNELLEAARAYAPRGWRVHPLRTATKLPLLGEWQHKATTDPDQIRGWWTRWPVANIGIATGAASGLLVVDIDAHHGGEATWDALAAEHGQLPEVPTVLTPHGGFHLYFRHPGGDVLLPNTTGALGPGIDTRGDGGYVVAPPSVAEGKEYHWEASSTPDMVKLAALPGWILERLTEKKKARPGPVNVQSDDGEIAEGERNAKLAVLAGILRRAGFGEDGMLAALLAENERRCKPPLPAEEVETIAASVARYEPAEMKSRAVQVIAGRWDRLVADAAEALDAIELFDRGGDLVRPVRVGKETIKGVRREPDAIVLRSANPEWLRVELARRAAWVSYQKREKKTVMVDPPKEVARTLVAAPDLGNWPTLRAVVRHPIVTQDGRRIMLRGYDMETQLLIDIDGGWPDLPIALSIDEAIAARRRLEHHIRYMPFVTNEDRAVALSLLLTALARPVLDTAPLHAMDAPTMATGKSMLIDVAAILATGSPASVLEYASDPAEAGKRLDGMLLAGDALIAIDNVEASIEGAALCQTLTQTRRSIRVLGGHKIVGSWNAHAPR